MIALFHPMMAVLALAWASMAGAQPMGRPPGMGGGPPAGPPAFLEELFPPALIMRNQSEIGLTDAQRDAISEAMAETEKKLVQLQWQSEAESEKLAKLLHNDTVDEGAALAQAQRVLGVEQEIKRAHLGLLIRIKNRLAPAQQKRLRELRATRRPEPHGPPGPPE
jgi:Spy/CpxP family protein refolding chaperone